MHKYNYGKQANKILHIDFLIIYFPIYNFYNGVNRHKTNYHDFFDVIDRRVTKLIKRTKIS